MESKEIKVRVVKGNWKTNETLYLSEPMTVEEAVKKQAELVPTLSERGSGETILVKFVEDLGPNFDYMSCGGWFIYTHKEPMIEQWARKTISDYQDVFDELAK